MEMVDKRLSSQLGMTSDSTWEVEHISAPATPASLRSLRRGVSQFAGHVPLSPQERSDLELAVGEACTNALKHGSPLREEDEIRITCMTDGSTLIIEVTDCGDGFKPDSIPSPKIGQANQNGMGIYIMRLLMDAVEFTFGRGTTVRMIKHCNDANHHKPGSSFFATRC